MDGGRGEVGMVVGVWMDGERKMKRSLIGVVLVVEVVKEDKNRKRINDKGKNLFCRDVNFLFQKIYAFIGHDRKTDRPSNQPTTNRQTDRSSKTD